MINFFRRLFGRNRKPNPTLRRGSWGDDMRDVPIDNPFDYREDGSIRPGDPAYAAMMDMMKSGKPQIGNQRIDGTWDIKDAR